MAEYIERESLVCALTEIIEDYKDGHTFSTDFAATIVTDILNDTVKCHHAADVAPVVRCKDCKHYDKTEIFNCKYSAMEWVHENDYCSRGERKE